MTVTTEPGFYDVHMVGADEPSMLPLETSPWRQLYEQASALVPREKQVMDLGCGTGRFAEQLDRDGRGPVLGVDFSRAAVKEARRYAPNCMFRVVDLRDWRPKRSDVVYTCLEMLEHLEDDIGLIERIPPGHTFVFSVPDFPAWAHLRTFPKPGDAMERYGHLLEFTHWQHVPKEPGKSIHLYRAVRK